VKEGTYIGTATTTAAIPASSEVVLCAFLTPMLQLIIPAFLETLLSEEILI